MARLVIRTKKQTSTAVSRPSKFERFARRFYEARMHSAIREIERRSLMRQEGL